MKQAPQPPPSWAIRLKKARWLWVPLLAFCLSRFGIILIAYISLPLLPESVSPPPYHIRSDHMLLDLFGSRWDTGFYLSIAEKGYRYQDTRLPSVAFFPLLPLYIRLFMNITNDPLIAGLLVTNIALLLASIFFYRLVAEEWGQQIAERAVWYLLIFPVSFFGSAIYSEALFLLGSIGSLYFMRKGYWESAAMLAFMSTLTRFVGLIVVPMLLLEWWALRQAKKQASLRLLLAPALAPLGTLSYMLFLQYRFGDPLAFVNGSAAWGREPRPIWEIVAKLLEQPSEGWTSALLAGNLPINDWFDFLIVLFFIALGVILLAQRRWSEAVFVLLGALIPLNSGLLMSQRRYMWVLFPVYILLARWGENNWVDRLITMLFLLGLGLFTALFANWYWVA